MKTFLLIICLLFALPVSGQTSRLGSYTATVVPTGGAQRAGEFNSVRVVVKNRAGVEVYEVSKEIPYDVPFPSAGVFESGNLMLIYGFDGFIEFYDQNGALLTTLRPLKDARPEHERNIAVAVHDSIAALLISEPGMEGCELLTVSDRGDVLSSTRVNGANAGSLIAAGTPRWEGSVVQEETHFVTSSGISRGSVEAGFTRGEFSPDDAFFLGWTNRKASTVSIGEMKIAATLAVQQGEMILKGVWNGPDAVILSAANPTLEKGSWVYRHPVLRSLTTTGLVKLLQEVPSAEFTSATLEPSGDQVIMKLETAIGQGRK
jgi:hypothetical protein